MAGRVTIKDIAREAGVSAWSVHCALAGKDGVGAKTRERVVALAAKMGYRPNVVAASLKRKAVRVGAAFPEPKGENRFYFTGVWDGVRACLRAASELNVQLVELPYRKTRRGYEKKIEALCDSGGLDGLLAVGFMDDFGQASLATCAQAGIPTVLVGEDVPHEGRLCCVQPDYGIVGRVMGELLSRQIPADGAVLLCAGNAAMPSHYQVVDGFLRYFNEHGVRSPVLQIHTEELGKGGVARIVDELSRHRDIAACASVNARGSVLLGEALVAAGKAGAMPVVGSDLFPESAAFLKAGVFTTIIHKNPYTQAYLAAQALVDFLLRGAMPVKPVVFIHSDVIFQSSLPMYSQGLSAPVFC